MQVRISIERSLDVPVPYPQAMSLLEDYPRVIRRFPKMRRLTRLGQDRYLSELAPIGSKIAGIAHEVSYAAHYEVDPGAGRLHWMPLEGHGNARIEGALQVIEHDRGARLEFDVRGELRDVPVPLMYRLVAPPFIQGKFTRLIDVFLEITREAIESGDGAGGDTR
ncbi:MAG: hypothetical protein PHP86_03475 [Nevskiales bacterium]|nr:hypothetical protein [Nevskiales bacterium]